MTNGLGGYASGTLSGALTRRYHGLLIAALPTPFGRTMMLNFLWERLRWPDGRAASLYHVTDTDGREGSRQLEVSHRLPPRVGASGLDVRRRRGPVREARADAAPAEHHAHHAIGCCPTEPVRLELRPFVAFRLHEAPVSHPVDRALHGAGARRSLRNRARRRPAAAAVVPVRRRTRRSRSRPSRSGRWRTRSSRTAATSAAAISGRPDISGLRLAPDAPGTLVASTESWETIGALNPEELPQRRAPPPQAAARVGERRARTRHGGGARAGGRPVHHHARRTHRGGGARARRRRRGAGR